MEKSKEKKEESLKGIKEKLEQCQKLKDEYLASWQRERADFINYKKDEMERVSELLKYADIALILKLLPVLDNFEIVENKIPEELKKDQNIKGLLQTKEHLRDFLKNRGIEEIDCLNEKFDPNFQEVVETKEVEGAESGIIIEQVQKGYKLNNKVLRPAKVKITK